MKSVKPFFTTVAKKCKYSAKGETHQTSEREQLREPSTYMERSDANEGQSTGINSAGNSERWAANPKYPSDSSHYSSAVHTFTNKPLQPNQEREQCSVAGSYQGNSAELCDPLLQQPLFTSPSDLGRHWHHIHKRWNCQQTGQNFHFTVVSYNVLADGLLYSNSHLYNGTEQWLKQWEYRRRNLLKELLHYNADVLCLQEVEMCHYDDWFEPKLREKGYTGVYKKRTGDKADGCATFFKESRFTLVKSKLVSFNKPGVTLMDRDNVAVVVLLKPRITGRGSHHSNSLLCVSNTHLLFNKKRGDIKLAQLACLFAEIEELARISPPGKTDSCYHPIICCGDFNSTPFSPIYDFVVRGFLDYNGMHRDNFSGQSYFRKCTQRQALTSNLLPWELGITTSCVKRNESSNIDEHLQPSTSRNLAIGSASCHPSSQTQGNSSNCGIDENYTGNSEHLQIPGNSTLSSMQCNPEERIELQSAQCSTSISRSTCTQSQPMNTMQSETVQQEGGQTSTHCLEDTTEKDAYNASTIQRHHFNFFSAYRHYFRDGQPEVTTFHDQVCTTVDYMFVSPGQQQYCRRCQKPHGPLQLTGNLELLTESDIWYLNGLPNKYLSSDHLSLVSSFLLHV